MRPKKVTLWAGAAALLFISLQACSAPEADSSAAPPGLLRYAATYDNQALLEEPAIAGQLQKLLGAELDHLKRNLDVAGSIDVRSGWLSIEGNAPHAGTEEEAVICVRTDNNDVRAAIFSKSKITIYSPDIAYENLPLCIKDWITLVNSLHRDRLTPPANVVFGQH